MKKIKLFLFSILCKHLGKVFCPTFGIFCSCIDGSTDSVYDVNQDGDENLDDLIYVLRSIADPLQTLNPNDPVADVNADGVVDLNDAIATIGRMTQVLGEAALGDLDTTYFDNDDNFPWDQPALTLDNVGRRHLFGQATDGKGSYDFFESIAQHHRQTQRDDDIAPGGTSFLAKGTGPDPTIAWDFDNCKRDPAAWSKLSLLEKAKAHAGWAKFAGLNLAAALVLPDGSRAYTRYRSNTGSDLAVDYNKAIAEDPTIQQFFASEVAGVKADVLNLFDGQSFDFYASKARSVPNGETENWQKAIGGHRIWSKGSVEFIETDCQLSIDLTIKMEDYYNFNPGQVDIATGIPDNDNCLFAVIGWASPFFSRGSITRSLSVDLECCKDEDCGSGEVCRDYECALTCPGTQQSGGQGTTRFSVDLTKSKGSFIVSYDMYDIPDELRISYEGSTVYSTGGLVSGSRTDNVPYGSDTSTSTVVDVVVSAPNTGTVWIVSVTCADEVTRRMENKS